MGYVKNLYKGTLPAVVLAVSLGCEEGGQPIFTGPGTLPSLPNTSPNTSKPSNSMLKEAVELADIVRKSPSETGYFLEKGDKQHYHQRTLRSKEGVLRVVYQDKGQRGLSLDDTLLISVKENGTSASFNDVGLDGFYEIMLSGEHAVIRDKSTDIHYGSGRSDKREVADAKRLNERYKRWLKAANHAISNVDKRN